MAIPVTSFAELDALKVTQAREFIVELVQEEQPTINVKTGALRSILAHLEGILAAKNEEELARLRRSMSLLEIAEDPDLADDELVEAVASNFRISRIVGAEARGPVTMIVSALEALTLAAGSVFEAEGKTYTIESPVVVRTSDELVQSVTDKVLTPRSDGNYAFSFEVVASAVGADYQITKDTLIVPQVPPVNYVTSFAGSDFTGGVDSETNADLAGRVISGVSARGISGRANMDAALRDRFSGIIAGSIIGAGDEEMRRDKHTIWPGSVGFGRIDWYIRTQARVQRLGLTKTATLVDKSVDNRGTWQVAVTRDEAPGFFDLVSVVLEGASNELGGFEVSLQTLGYDLTELDNEGFLPDVVSAVEARYSRFATLVVQFYDDLTDTTDLTEGSSTQDYDLTLRVMPSIAEIQEWVSDRDVHHAAADVLVKAPVPCFVRVSFNLELKANQEEPDTNAIKDAIAAAVNLYGFTGRLPASIVINAAQELMTSPAHITNMQLSGAIHRPTGTIAHLTSSDVLEVPDEPEAMVTARTVAFYLDPEDVVISVVTAAIPEI